MCCLILDVSVLSCNLVVKIIIAQTCVVCSWFEEFCSGVHDYRPCNIAFRIPRAKYFITFLDIFHGFYLFLFLMRWLMY